MSTPWPAFCETADLAAELADSAGRVGLSVAPTVATLPQPPPHHGWLWLRETAPAPADVARVAVMAASSDAPGVACFAAASSTPLHALSGDFGLPATWDVPAAASLAVLRACGGELAHRASRRALARSLAVRLGDAPDKPEARAGKLVASETGVVSWVGRGSKREVPLGSPAIARQVLSVLGGCGQASPVNADVRKAHPERTNVDEVLFGPARRLSDPASKAALAPYGIPLPQEELCASPSRAASEAARMGFPVRITLASPDLRDWDEPDLTVDGVDNAARVRDVYRQLVSLAQERNADARVLGVTVTQTRLARSLLSLRATPLEEGIVLAELGFADPHGAASRDFTWLPLPTTPEAVDRAVQRLHGASLVLAGSHTQRGETCAQLAELLGSLHAFIEDFPAEVSEVRLHPVALLLGGEAEARQAAVTVTDAYTRQL